MDWDADAFMKGDCICLWRLAKRTQSPCWRAGGNPFEAACSAVLVHGRVARLTAGPAALTNRRIEGAQIWLVMAMAEAIGSERSLAILSRLMVARF